MFIIIIIFLVVMVIAVILTKMSSTAALVSGADRALVIMVISQDVFSCLASKIYISANATNSYPNFLGNAPQG